MSVSRLPSPPGMQALPAGILTQIPDLWLLLADILSGLCHVQLTNDFTVSSLYTALLGMLTPRSPDWVTAENTAVTAIMALPPTTIAALAADEVDASPSTSAYNTGGRRLLARLVREAGMRMWGYVAWGLG